MIDYSKIHESILFYEKQNFTRIEVPWTVTKYVEDITKPLESHSIQIKDTDDVYLVGSGEQSFLQLYLKEYLPKGQFQTVTPCFRSEEQYDYLHSPYFIKNELIKTDVVNIVELDKIVENSILFFGKYITDVKLDIIPTSIGYDIECMGYELGSYGIRHCDFVDWIYATGCAEPRLSKVIKALQRI